MLSVHIGVRSEVKVLYEHGLTTWRGSESISTDSKALVTMLHTAAASIADAKATENAKAKTTGRTETNSLPGLD